MIDIFSFVVGFFFGGLLLFVLQKNISAWQRGNSAVDVTASVNGDDARLSAANLARQKKKVEAKEKIVNLLQGQSRATREDVENSLGVSMATAVRYLDELESEGRVAQLGESRETYYELGG